MKVTVTHLKAPWPTGTQPGHVVDFVGRDAIPGWALGKCTPAADDAEVTHTVEAPAAPAQAVAESDVSDPLAAAEAQAEAEKAALSKKGRKAAAEAG